MSTKGSVQPEEPPCTEGSLPISEVLRASFHDAASYSPNASAVLGGARGCMRYEHFQGIGAHVGLVFLFENHFWEVFNSPVSHLNLRFSFAVFRNWVAIQLAKIWLEFWLEKRLEIPF